MKKSLETFRELIKKEAIVAKDINYHKEAYGSWYIVFECNPLLRVINDNKEQWLLIEEITNEVYLDIPVWKEKWKGKLNEQEIAVYKLKELINENA